MHSREITASSRRKIKIAVLDTGYDAEADFFRSRDRKSRLTSSTNQWKDFVESSKRPVDFHGHGTRVLSLLMQLAPLADIYVARIASNSDDFPASGDRISKVSQRDKSSSLVYVRG